jgi:hypothetical protein
MLIHKNSFNDFLKKVILFNFIYLESNFYMIDTNFY